ncbi:hypothetical protein ACFFV7_50975 [Nonomuraea spiralis]|uniref:Uncharacterized protein n=1 Tax=Nonomuraea spiralis TaxID=46182 RepID=A0ABV5J0A6_9ACTN|nr:hypothetical protein [Nonomuraea spiralis]GGS88474.1 hypothetical protein GCM10010176_035310 [Nonomuraea spiralis]
MAVYVRGAGGHIAERVQAEPGSDDETRYEQLAADPASGWRRLDDVVGAGTRGSAPTTQEPVQEPVELGKRPPQAAPKQAWVDWAAAHGMDADQADDLTKAQLIELADQLDKE